MPDESRFYHEMPFIEKNNDKVKKVYFRYYDPQAKEVDLVCSVDNWSRFSHQMHLNNYGFWEITMSFTKGIYYYYYCIDSRKIIDLENQYRVNDKIKGQLSYFIVE